MIYHPRQSLDVVFRLFYFIFALWMCPWETIHMVLCGFLLNCVKKMNLYKADQEQKGRHRQHLGAVTGFKLCISLRVSLLKMPPIWFHFGTLKRRWLEVKVKAIIKRCVSLYLKTPGIRTRIQRPQNLSWILHNPLEVFQNQSLAFCFAILLLHACSDRSLSLTRYLGNILY